MRRNNFSTALTLLVLLVGSACLAQTSEEQTVEGMKTPSSPGFILMDQTPTSIARPTTPKGLAMNIVTLAQGGALEVAPFWLYRHSKVDASGKVITGLTFDDFIKIKVPIYSHFSLSVATVKKNDSTQIAVGVRTHLLHLRSKHLMKETTKVSKEIDSLLELYDPEGDPAEMKKIQDSLKEKREEISKLYQPTFQAEIAAAYLGTSPGSGSFDNIDRARSGAWLTLSYRPYFKSQFEIVGVVRYLDNPNFSGYDRQTRLMDFGGRALYPVDKWGLSIEYINRQVVNGNFKSYDRLAGVVEYKISDTLFLTATYGKNFDENNNIIALLGINFGFSTQDLTK